MVTYKSELYQNIISKKMKAISQDIEFFGVEILKAKDADGHHHIPPDGIFSFDLLYAAMVNTIISPESRLKLDDELLADILSEYEKMKLASPPSDPMAEFLKSQKP
jgi:hypothetical protein